MCQFNLAPTHLSSLSLLESTIVLYRWFRNYLSDHYQCVKINNSTSMPVRIHAGVPQGAILSPLLFIIYMNDIASLSMQDQASFTNLFADDTSLYVANGDPTMLATELQQAVDDLSECLIISFWVWILRKPRFWFPGRKECRQFTSQSGYVEMLYTKWTNISIWGSSSTPHSPGRTMWTTFIARQCKELASSTASENDYLLKG